MTGSTWHQVWTHLSFAVIVISNIRPIIAAKPHIVFILLDDVGYNDVSWHNEQMHTPYLHKLAQEGVILESYYAYFVCTPSRASLLTGYYSDKLGMQRDVLAATTPYGIPLRFKLISDRLRNTGYSTHAMGKWHVGFCDWKYTPTYRGFDTFLGLYNGAGESYKHCSNYLFNTSKGECVGFDFHNNCELAHQYDGQYSSEIYTRHATEIIRSWKPYNKPMFLYISYTDTHFPVQPPKRYIDKCGHNVNSARHRFCGAMAAVDEGVENITKALKENGLYENTVIIFSSDNGGATDFGASNSPLRGEKTTIFEGGTRVPAFVHSPLLKKKSYINRKLIHISDWYPTILRLAGAKRVIGLDGVNQWPTINNNMISPRKYLPYHMDVYDNGTYVAAVRDKRYKLIVGSGGVANKILPECDTEDNSFNLSYYMWYVNHDRPWFNFSDTTVKLYDLLEDPSEMRNIVNKMPDKYRELMYQVNVFKDQSKPFANFRTDPKGNPENFGNSFVPGWCEAYTDTPAKKIVRR